jgi:hypothetical protein
MLNTDRLTETVRDRGKDLINAGAGRLTGALRGHGKAAVFAGTALALAGAGSASAAAVGSATTTPMTDLAAHYAGPLTAADLHGTPLSTASSGRPLAASATQFRPSSSARTTTLIATLLDSMPAAGTGHHAGTGQHAGPRGHHRDTRKNGRPAKSARAVTWRATSNKPNRMAKPAAAAHRQVPPADQLMPTGTTGPQNFMQLSPAQVQNAKTIVRQALDMRMGVRSAVIAVATAMQESRLMNIGYGTGDSLGLFQQQADMGWGSAQQIMNPVYSSDAFLRALGQYQASNPGWARQPLWQAAQGVQASGFPTAYAQWETQAAHLVQQAAQVR